MQKPSYIVGIDEVGRGPLAGPVTVCACKVSSGFDMGNFTGIKDSKKLTEAKREEWLVKILQMKEKGELDFAFTSISAEEIDKIGISPSIQKALDKSLSDLNLDAESTQILLDGSLHAPNKFIHQETIIKGDEKIPLISAASIIAKVNRDKYMSEQSKIYSVYGFEKHKGYGTAFHLEAIKKNGISPIHRKSFLGNIAFS